jgi:CRP/FNR family transcriptional regulator, cyclic AMP receptor protein
VNVLLRNRSQKVDVLKNIPMFSYLTKKQLEEVARHADEIEVEAGTVIAREGERGHELFVIVGGTATVTRHGETLATLRKGDFVGEMSLLDGKPRSASVVAADEPLSLLVISAREFEPLLLAVPKLGVRLLMAMAARLRDADEALTH